MLKRLALMAVLTAAVAVVAVQAAAAAPVAKTFVFCSDISYPPEEFVQGGKNLGSDIDIGTAVAKRLGMSAKFQNTGFDGIVAALLSNKCDAIISGMNDTPERRKSVAFVDYLSVGQSLIGKKGNPLKISDSLDVCGRVGRRAGRDDEPRDAAEVRQAVQGEGQEGDQDHLLPEGHRAASRASRPGTSTSTEPTRRPSSGTRRRTRRSQIVGKPITPASGRDRRQSEEHRLKAQIQKAINAMYANGSMTKILKKWNMSAVRAEEVSRGRGRRCTRSSRRSTGICSRTRIFDPNHAFAQALSARCSSPSSPSSSASLLGLASALCADVAAGACCGSSRTSTSSSCAGRR